jgi:uncharacterized protein YaaW (UPF0174 family)
MTFLPWLLIAMLVGIAWLFLNGMLAGRERNNRRSEPTLRDGVTASKSNNEPASIPMATYAEVKAEFDLRFRLWREAGGRIVNRMRWLSAQNFDGMDVPELLTHTSAEERSNLAVILGTAANSDPATIAHALRKAGSHGVASFLRGGEVSYEEVVRDVAIKLGAKNLPTTSTSSELERRAVGAAMEQILAKASPDERRAILEELAKRQTTSSNGLMTATGGLVLANLSGFGLYIAATSSLAAITSAVGLTLPFAVYSGMSGILATVTGPLGWAALAVVAIVQLGGAEYKKTVPGVIAIASSRARLIVDRDSEISNLNDQSNLHDERGRRLEVLESFIANMERNGTDQSVPRSSVPW